jgi:hypothetical protein
MSFIMAIICIFCSGGNECYCLILPAALGPGVYSAPNRNEYLKQKNNVSGEYSSASAQG